MKMAYKAKVAAFDELLSEDVIDSKQLKKLCFEGCPSEKGIRAKCWKLMLNYLPPKRGEWQSRLEKERRGYKQFVDDLIVQPGRESYDTNRTDVTLEDHPLNPNPTSQWSQYFKDNDMLLQIDKDCRRLCPDLAFFQSPTKYPNEELVCSDSGLTTLRKRVEQSVLKAQNVSRNRSGITVTDYKRPRRGNVDDYIVLQEGEEAHWEVAERILFVYGKLNPGQGYVQGMNEIIGPIYYTYASDPDTDQQVYAEADTFWCFTNLMSEIRDNFIKTLDDDPSCGIGMMMNKLMTNLKSHDTALWCRLNEQELRPQFYAFRWLTLLLSQEFALPDVLRLWDSLFSDTRRFDFLLDICISMLILIRGDLLKNDFPNNMKLIQSYPITDVHVILSKAVELSGRR